MTEGMETVGEYDSWSDSPPGGPGSEASAGLDYAAADHTAPTGVLVSLTPSSAL